MVFGHGGNTVTRMPEAAKGMEKLDLLVVADPHPTTWAVLAERKDNTYLLPICTQFEMRRLAHGVEPLAPVGRADRQADLRVEERLRGHVPARQEARLRRPDVQEHQGREQRCRSAEDILREINRGGWSTGYCGQSPERLKAHMRNQDKFDLVTLRAPKDDPGDRRRLLRPAVAVLGHAGAQASRHAHPLQHQPARDGRRRHVPRALRRRARGKRAETARVERRTTCWPKARTRRLGDQGRLSGVHLRRAQEARLGQGPHRSRAGHHRADRRQRNPDGVSLGDRPLGRHPARRDERTAASTTATARRAPMRGTCPIRSRCIASRSTRRGRTWSRSIRRCRTRGSSACRTSASTCRRRRWTRASPSSSRSSCTSGRLVEYEGGGEETRSNKWLAELQQDMFVEINPRDAAERGIKDGDWVWVIGPGDTERARLPHEGAGHRARRQGRHLVSVPLRRLVHGRRPCAANTRKGADPIVLGESVNTHHDLRLRSGDRHAGDRKPRSARSGQLKGGINHGPHEIPLRRRPLHRVQRLRHRLQERARGAVGHQPPARRHHQRRQAGRALDLDGLHALHRRALRGGVPGELLLHHRRRRGAALQGPLHRLRLLLLRVPVRRAAISAGRQFRLARQDGQVHLLRRRPGGRQHARPSS